MTVLFGHNYVFCKVVHSHTFALSTSPQLLCNGVKFLPKIVKTGTPLSKTYKKHKGSFHEYSVNIPASVIIYKAMSIVVKQPMSHPLAYPVGTELKM